VRRVVSLVPSLTETVAVTAAGLLAGATDWCSHPAGLDEPRVRGTKNPDLDRIRALKPDLVLANDQKNRAPDLAALRAAGHAERYPKVPLDHILAALPDLIILPDEPYRFTADDGPECFPRIGAALVSGRNLIWYGPGGLGDIRLRHRIARHG
jgi:hypothetical protein